MKTIQERFNERYNALPFWGKVRLHLGRGEAEMFNRIRHEMALEAKDDEAQRYAEHAMYYRALAITLGATEDDMLNIDHDKSLVGIYRDHPNDPAWDMDNWDKDI